MSNVREFNDVAELNAIFAAEICQRLEAGIAEKGRASLLVSGGRTPKALFNRLSETALDWSSVDVSLVDERWVDEADSASNTAMVKRELLVNKASVANFVPLKTEHADPTKVEALKAVANNVKSLSLPFDVLILGMGEDGHTASIFPCADPELRDFGLDRNSGHRVVSMKPSTAPHQRISLTMPTILSAKQIYLHLVGAAKKPILEQALNGKDEKEMPIRAVLHQSETPVDVMFAE